MFIIIDPSQHLQFKNLIVKFHDSLILHHGTYLDPIDMDKAIYFIEFNKQSKYLGGAYLIKRESKEILKRTGLLSERLKDCMALWEVGGIHVDCQRGKTYANLAVNFYTDLYKRLRDFCNYKGIPYVCTHMTYVERSSISQYGNWPIVGHIADSLDGNMCYSFLRLDVELLPAKEQP